jgi:hypothetical protein
MGMRAKTGRPQPDGVSHVDQNQNCRSRPRHLAVTGSMASTTTQAEAKGFGLGWGIGAGLLGAAVVGSAIAASNDGYYYDGDRRCGWVRQFDAYGNYIGRVRSCNYY